MTAGVSLGPRREYLDTGWVPDAFGRLDWQAYDENPPHALDRAHDRRRSLRRALRHLLHLSPGKGVGSRRLLRDMPECGGRVHR